MLYKKEMKYKKKVYLNWMAFKKLKVEKFCSLNGISIINCEGCENDLREMKRCVIFFEI